MCYFLTVLVSAIVAIKMSRVNRRSKIQILKQQSGTIPM